VLRDETGAPILPPSVQASISHKDDVAVCLLRNGDAGACVRACVRSCGVCVRVCMHRSIALVGRVLILISPPQQQHNTAVSNIGVDVEVCEPRKRTASIAPRVLTEKERCVPPSHRPPSRGV